MSEATGGPAIDTFPDIGFDYSMGEPNRAGTIQQILRSGRMVHRGVRPAVRTFELIRKSGSTEDAQTIRKFHRKNRTKKFVFNHPAYVFDGSADIARNFPVEFERPPQIVNVGANSWFIDVRLREAVGFGPANQLLTNPSFNFWATANQPTGWTSNTDNTEEPASNFTEDGSALEILADGTAGVGEVKQDVSAIIKPSSKYIVSGQIRRNATWDTGVDFDFFGTGLDTTGLQLPIGSIPNGSWAYFEGQVADGGIGNVPDAEFRIQANGSPTVAGECYIDQLMLVEGIVAGHRLYPDDDINHPTAIVIATADGVVVAGTWTTPFNALATDGFVSTNVNTDTTSKFDIPYYGYGFSLSYLVGTFLGIFDVYLDDVKVATVDSYKAGGTVLYKGVRHLNVPLGFHRVTIQTTNTRNAASSTNTIGIDSLEALI